MANARLCLFSGVETGMRTGCHPRLGHRGLVYLSGYQLASSCGEPRQWLETVDDVAPFIDFGPRIGDITDDAMAHTLWPADPSCSLNRGEAIIAAERSDLRRYAHFRRSMGKPLFRAAGGAPRQNRRGILARIFRRCQRFPATVVDTPSARATCWRRAGRTGVRLVARGCRTALGNAVATGWSGHRGGDCAPTRERYSSHTKTYESLRQ